MLLKNLFIITKRTDQSAFNSPLLLFWLIPFSGQFAQSCALNALGVLFKPSTWVVHAYAICNCGCWLRCLPFSGEISQVPKGTATLLNKPQPVSNSQGHAAWPWVTFPQNQIKPSVQLWPYSLLTYLSSPPHYIVTLSVYFKEHHSSKPFEQECSQQGLPLCYQIQETHYFPNIFWNTGCLTAKLNFQDSSRLILRLMWEIYRNCKSGKKGDISVSCLLSLSMLFVVAVVPPPL